MKFVVFEDNGGSYHWTIVADSGESLVQSASFASYEDATKRRGSCAPALPQHRSRIAPTTPRRSISSLAAMRRARETTRTWTPSDGWMKAAA
jgi:hypothetical protein